MQLHLGVVWYMVVDVDKVESPEGRENVGYYQRVVQWLNGLSIVQI
jgi:hypothetical protein